MKITIKGLGTVVKLDKSTFRGAGGEGEVHVTGNNRAYKIYHDPSKMIPLGKITELNALTAPYIFKPEHALLNEKNVLVGYDMAALPSSEPLCKLFTKDFRNSNHITPEMILGLVKKLHTGVKHCHNNNILVVDLNEMNFLVDPKFQEVYFIDCDSYKTLSFPPTALMISVRDPLAFKESGGNAHYSATEMTDWYSYGIVTFQMMIGAHPFKGSNAKFDHIPKKDCQQMLARMTANVSAMNLATKLPAVCQPLSVIPQVYREWFEAVFERGQRIAPPEDFTCVIVLTPRITRLTGSQNYDITEVYTLSGDIVYYSNGIAITSNAVFNNGKKMINTTDSIVLGFTPKVNHPVVARVQGGLLRLFDLTANKEMNSTISAQEVMSYDGRIYVRNHSSVFEIEYTELPTNILVTAKKVGEVLEQSTQFYQGVAIQNLLGGYYAALYPQSGKCYEIRMKEFDGYRIVDAKFKSGVMVLVGEKNGKYDKFICRFAPDYQSYDVRMATDITTYDINFTVLESGVVLMMNENEELELFANRKDSQGIKVVSDTAIDGDCKLFHAGAQAMFAKDDKLFKFNLRK